MAYELDELVERSLAGEDVAGFAGGDEQMSYRSLLRRRRRPPISKRRK